MIKIKATVEDKKQVEKISKDIIQYLKETYFNIIADIYKQIFKKDIKYNEIEENDLFFQAVRNNKITIHNNKIKGKFNSKLTKYIREKLKGKWNNKTKSYTVETLPYNVKQYINKQKEKIQLFNDKIQEFLNDYSYNINQSIEQAPVDYNNIITNIKEQIQDNLKDFIVKPEINENIQQEINENYINNSKLSIKNWQESNISKLRQEMQEQVLNGGYSNQSIAEFIQNNYGTTQKKAIFLARNEAKLINGEYSKQQYLENGITKYIWQTSKDERVREDHKILDGKIFDFRDPPIIDSKTGKRGNPQEDYGCYGKNTEILTKKGFKLLKNVELGEEVATINKDTLQFEWGFVINKVKYFCKDIYKIYNNNFNLFVSQDHTFWQWKKKYNNKHTIKNSDYNLFTKGINSLSKRNSYFLATCNKQETQKQDFIYKIPTKIFCQFMGFYLSDGNIDKRTNNCLMISQQKNDWMFNILKDYLHIRQGKDKLYIYNKDLFNLVKDMKNCYYKYIPEIIKSLDADYIRIFLNSFCLCDGNGKSKKDFIFFNGRKTKVYNAYYTTSPRMMADLVECIYKTNMSCSVYLQKNKEKIQQFKNGFYTLNYDLYIIQEMKTKKRTMEKMTIKKQSYNDYVYDIEVNKNNTILVKQDKSIHWNSNCRCVANPIIDWK